MSYQLDSRRLLIVVSLVLVLVLAGCTGQPSDQGSQGDENLKVGAILPLSGPLAIHGNAIRGGMELAKEDLREEGINISIVYEDSKAKSKEGVKAYRRLRSLEDIDVAVSALSRVSVPILELAQEDEIPLIMTATSATGITEGNEYGFRFSPSPSNLAKVPFEGIVKQNETVALLYVQDEYGKSIAKELKKEAKKRGIEIVEEEVFRPDDRNFRAQLTKIKEADPDVFIHLTSSPSLEVKIIKQARELGLDSKIVESSIYLAVKSSRKKLGDLAEGAYTEALPSMISEDHLSDSGKKFRKEFKERHNSNPFFTAYWGYDIVNLIGKSTKGRKISGKDIADSISNYGTYKSLNGPINISENGEINPPLVPVKVVNGSLQRGE